MLLTFPACHSMLYSLRSACTSVHSLYNCCINCEEARQTFRKRNHSNSLPQLKCLCSPTVTRKVKIRLKTRTELSFFKAGCDTPPPRPPDDSEARRPWGAPGSHRSMRAATGVVTTQENSAYPSQKGKGPPETATGCTQLQG